MLAHYYRIVKDTDERVKYSLNTQIQTEGCQKGGFVDKKGLVHGKYAIYRVTTAIAAYCNPDSAYYRREKVFKLIRNGLDYIMGVQHEDGLFDLISCNFYSAPDTAFCVKRMLPYLKYLETQRTTSQEEEIYQILKQIVFLAAQGLKTGGFHTPNHRWAIASNLMECGRYFSDHTMTQRAEQYLAEGIDCNEDGEFAEKSAGNYNRINNDAMITLGDITGEERYYEYAVRNLHMMLTYIEPDGSIFTANSTRQDNGKQIFPKDYYMEYLDMGYRRDIPEFLNMANYIMELVEEKQLTAPDFLIHLMNRPELIDLEHQGRYVPADFKKLYKESGILRARSKAGVYTLMSGKMGFLHFSNETMHLEMKLGGSFCEHRGFSPDKIEQTREGYSLKQTMHGWYYLPFDEAPDTSDWWKMDHGKRKKVMGPDLGLEAAVREIEDGIQVCLRAEGVNGAPFRVEMAVTGSDYLWNDQFVIRSAPGNSMVLKDGKAVFSNGTDSIEIGPGFGTHIYTDGKFGSEEKSAHAFTLYFTDYTPFEHCITIQSGKKIM